MSGFPHLRAAIVRRPWAMQPDWLAAFAEVMERRVNGERLSPNEVAEAAGKHSEIGKHTHVLGVPALNGSAIHFEVTDTGLMAARGGASRVAGDEAPGSLIAVISVMGVIAQHASQVESISGPGGTSTERVGQALDAAMADPAVKAVVFNVDSPGGNVHGVMELADKIMGHRGKKPMIAQVNSSAGSAAYWIVAATDEIVVPPSGEVGSIGVYCLHKDVSAAAEKEGVKFTFVKAKDSPHKVDGNPYEPLSGDALDYLQASTDAFMVDFLNGVARGRGRKVADVKANFGKGRMVRSTDAVKAGMADKIGTLEQTLARVAKMKPGQGMRAMATGTELAALTFVDAVAEDQAATVEAETLAAEPEPEPGATAEQTAATRDEFRRRRHAMRSRSA